VVWQGRNVRVRSLAPDDWKLLRKPPPQGVGNAPLARTGARQRASALRVRSPRPARVFELS
jgi:hypothetical protein